MGSSYFDIDSLLSGQDPYDPLGLDDFLAQEEERKRKEQEFNDTFLGSLLRPFREASQDTSSLKDAFVRAAGIPFEAAKAPIDYLASKPPQIFPGIQPLQQEHVQPAEKLLRSAIAPEILPGDVGDTAYETIMTPQGPIQQARQTTPEDIKTSEVVSDIIGKGIETTGGFAMNPLTPAMGLPGLGGKAVAASFLPGMSESLGEQIGTGISAIESGKPEEAAEPFTGGLLDLLFLGGITSHLGKSQKAPTGSEVRQSEAVNGPSEMDLASGTVSPKWGLQTKRLDAPSVGRLRFDNMMEESVKRLDEALQEVFPGTEDAGKVPYSREQAPEYFYGQTTHPEANPGFKHFIPERKPGLRLNITELLRGTGNLSGFARQVADTLVHERFAHAEGNLHGLTRKDAEGNTYYMRDTPEGRQKVIIPDVPPGSLGGAEKAKYGQPADFGTETRGDAAFHNPKILEIRDAIEQNIINNPDMVKDLLHERLRGITGRGIEVTKAERVGPEISDLDEFLSRTSKEQGGMAAPKRDETISEPADIIRKLLAETKLTKFNIATVVKDLKAKGVELPGEVTQILPDLLTELKDRGWINEKIAGTYTLNLEPPRKTSKIAEDVAKVTPQDKLADTLQASIEAAPEREVPAKPVSEPTSEPVILADEAKQKARERMEAQLAREEAQRLRDAELDKLTQKRRDAQLQGDSKTANELNSQIQELRTSPLPELKPKAPPGEKTLEDRMAALTPDQIKAIQNVFQASGGKPKKAVPKELQMAQQAAKNVLESKKTKTEPVKEAAPPKEKPKEKPKEEPPIEEPPSEIEEAASGEDKPRNWKVTLSDGTEHVVRAPSPDHAKKIAEKVLDEHKSTKRVDKVEEALSTLERAAKYEIEPVSAASQKISEDISETKKAVSEEVSEGKKLRSEEIRLEKEQQREKFAKKTYIVTLTNGEKVPVRARNEAVAKANVEAEIRKQKSGAKVASVTYKKTPIEAAVSGVEINEPTKKLEKGIFDDLTDIPKTLKSVFDISWPGRQGLFLLNRPEALKGMAKGVRGILPFKGEEFHKRAVEDLANRPNAKLYDKFKLNQVKWEPGDIAARSEQFASQIVSELPGFRHSEHAFNDPGNLSRANMFDAYDAQFRAAGKGPDTHPKLYEGMADYLNVLTMRKPLPEKLKQAGWIMNKMFFSPMAVYSRLQLTNPFWYAKLPREMQKAALRDIGGTLGTIMMMLGGVKIAAVQAGLKPEDVDVSFDPAHTHFARLKVKETYYDLAGLTPLLRTYYRMASGRMKTPKGEYILPGAFGTKWQREHTNLQDAPFGMDTWGQMTGFIENKTSPTYHAAKGMYKGEGYYGQDYGVADFLTDIAAPISLEETGQAWYNYGPEAAARQLPNFFGIGTFAPPPESKTVSGKGKNRKKKYNFNF